MAEILGGPVDIARSLMGWREFLGGEFRCHSAGSGVTLHRGQARVDGGLEEVAALREQLSAVLVLQRAEQGGALRIYRRAWNSQDDVWRNRSMVDFDASAVAGATSIDLIANEGDIYVFRSDLYHEVTTVIGDKDRITCGCFIGRVEGLREYRSWA